MAAHPADGTARSCGLARLRDLPHPGVPIRQALPHMTSDDRAETLAILSRLSDLDASTPA